MKRTPGIRTYLFVLIASCILPLAVVAGFLIFDFYENQQSQATKSVISRARAIVNVVDQDFASTQAALRALGTSRLLARGNLAAFHQRAVIALNNISSDSIALISPTGQFAMSTRRPFGMPLPNLGNPIASRIIKSDHAEVSDLFIGPVVGTYVYAVGVPVIRNGEIVWTLYATGTPSQLTHVLTDQKFPDRWRVTITDSAGTIVARSHDLEKFLGKKVVPDLLKRMREVPEGSLKTVSLEGIPLAIAYSRSNLTGWTVAIGIPQEDIRTELYRALMLLIIGTILSLAFGLVLASYVGGRIQRSMNALAGPARALGAGEVTTIPHLHFREANDLANAVRDAAETLRNTRFMAHHDALTGMANRTLFKFIVDRRLAQYEQDQKALAILYIDLDGFKKVNDTHGHATGDALLREVASRLTGAIRGSDIAARLGGDEFAVALIETDIQYAVPIAQKLVDILSLPYRLGDIEATISASIGVAAFPISARDSDMLMKKADKAMYQAKASGKRRICLATE